MDADRVEQPTRPWPRRHDADVGRDPPPLREHGHAVVARRERDHALLRPDLGARAGGQVDLGEDRLVGIVDAAVRLEHRRHARAAAELREDPGDLVGVEVEVRNALRGERGGHRLDDRAGVEDAGAPVDGTAAAAAELVPELERAQREAHVLALGVREPERARLRGRGRERVRDHRLVEQHDLVPALGERPGGARPHRARPGDHRSHPTDLRAIP